MLASDAARPTVDFPSIAQHTGCGDPFGRVFLHRVHVAHPFLCVSSRASYMCCLDWAVANRASCPRRVLVAWQFAHMAVAFATESPPPLHSGTVWSISNAAGSSSKHELHVQFCCAAISSLVNPVTAPVRRVAAIAARAASAPVGTRCQRRCQPFALTGAFWRRLGVCDGGAYVGGLSAVSLKKNMQRSQNYSPDRQTLLTRLACVEQKTEQTESQH